MIQHAVNKWRKHATLENQKKRLFQSSNQQNTRETQVLHSSASKHHALCNTSLSCQCSSRPDSQDFFQHMQHMHDSVQSLPDPYLPIEAVASWPHGLTKQTQPQCHCSRTPSLLWKSLMEHEIQSSGQHFETIWYLRTPHGSDNMSCI